MQQEHGHYSNVLRVILKKNRGNRENTRDKIQIIDSNKQRLWSNGTACERKESTRKLRDILKILEDIYDLKISWNN